MNEIDAEKMLCEADDIVAETRFIEALDALRKLGYSIALFPKNRRAARKSDTTFLRYAEEVTIKIKPPASWIYNNE